MHKRLHTWFIRPVLAALALFTALPLASDEPSQPAPRMQERLATVRLPRVTFDSMPLGQVLETLSALAEAQGTPVNLVRLAPGNDEPRVTMTLRDTNLERTLYYVAQSVGYRCEVEADAVVLRPASEPGATLRTEFFPVSRSALVRITGLSGLQNAAGGEQKVPSQIEVENALRAFLERAGVALDRKSVV
jgi:hypothetical protein